MEKTQEMTRLLRCPALYFVSHVFAHPWSSLGLPAPLFSYYPPFYRSVWPAREASLALVPRSYFLRMIVKLANWIIVKDTLTICVGGGVGWVGEWSHIRNKRKEIGAIIIIGKRLTTTWGGQRNGLSVYVCRGFCVEIICIVCKWRQ